MKDHLAFVLIGLFLYASSVQGFERQGIIRSGSSFAENPSDPDLFEEDSQVMNRLLVREIWNVPVGPRCRMEINTYLLGEGSSSKGSLTQYLLSSTNEQNRNSKLEHRWHNSDTIDGYLTFDRFNFRGRIGEMAFSIGRFPIDLSKTFVFRPNDFFAPFRPHEFNRNMKAGVDGLQFIYPFGSLGTIRWINVAGYESDVPLSRVMTDADSENRFSEEESSSIFYLSNNIGKVELAGFVGRYGEYDLAGITVEGEISQSLGLHVDAHQRNHRNSYFKGSEIAIGVDYRLNYDSLLLFEGFHHGTGYASVEEYKRIEDDPFRPLYHIGKNYLSVGLKRELTPITDLRLQMQRNLTDSSNLINAWVKHSVADNSELEVSWTYGQGEKPLGGVVRSEYGTYPKLLGFEFNYYF